MAETPDEIIESTEVLLKPPAEDAPKRRFSPTTIKAACIAGGAAVAWAQSRC